MKWGTFCDAADKYDAEMSRQYQRECENQQFICELEKRPMSSWTADEMQRYNELTGQG